MKIKKHEIVLLAIPVLPPSRPFFTFHQSHMKNLFANFCTHKLLFTYRKRQTNLRRRRPISRPFPAELSAPAVRSRVLILRACVSQKLAPRRLDVQAHLSAWSMEHDYKKTSCLSFWKWTSSSYGPWNQVTIFQQPGSMIVSYIFWANDKNESISFSY